MPYQEPEFLPWDGRRVPITFVGGYLGAGKTTAINALLAQTDRPIAVLVNDVGTVNIDASLIRRRHGDTIELTDGCVCCSLIDGFGAAFDQLRARDTPPDHVLVELSGVADPERVTPWGNSAGFVLDGVVVVVAADQLLDDSLSATIRGAIEHQAANADLVVLSKCDLLDGSQAAEVRRRLDQVAAGVPVFESDGSDASGSFLGLGGRRPGGVSNTPGATLFDAHEVRTVAMPRSPERADLEAALDDALAAVSGVVVRAKGVMATADDTLWLIQIVGRRREITELPMSEWQPITDLTVITLRNRENTPRSI